MLTFREEVGASAVLTDVEVLPQLAASLEAQHGVVVQAVVPEQNAAPWLQHLGRHTLWVTSSQVSRGSRRTRHLQVPETSHPADVLQDQLHLVGVDG